MIPLEEVERLYEICRRLRDERKKAAKLSDRCLSAPSGKAAQKANIDLNWAAMHVGKIEAELHAAAVDAGIADIRDASHYAERVARPSHWHAYPWTPAQPRAMTERKRSQDMAVGSGTVLERPF